MQGEFIAQYVNIQELIQRCYPDSNVTLEFTIQDILEFFSEIARSHWSKGEKLVDISKRSINIVKYICNKENTKLY